MPKKVALIVESYLHYGHPIYDVILRLLSMNISGLSNGDLIYESKVAKLLE
jgi:hypothetical protein